MSDCKRSDLDSFEAVAGNGLINRRALLGRGIALAGATTAGAEYLPSGILFHGARKMPFGQGGKA